MVHYIYQGVTCYNSQIKIASNIVDPGDMLHYASFYLGLHCCQSMHLGVASTQSVNSHTGPQLREIYIYIYIYIKILSVEQVFQAIGKVRHG